MEIGEGKEERIFGSLGTSMASTAQYIAIGDIIYWQDRESVRDLRLAEIGGF